MRLTRRQEYLLLEAVEAGVVCASDRRQLGVLRRLVRRRVLRPQEPPPGKVLLMPDHYPTARGRAYVRWWMRCRAGSWGQRVRRA